MPIRNRYNRELSRRGNAAASASFLLALFTGAAAIQGLSLWLVLAAAVVAVGCAVFAVLDWAGIVG